MVQFAQFMILGEGLTKLTPERGKDPGSVCVVTTTMYRGFTGDKSAIDQDNIRGNIALDLVKAATGKGFKVVVVDGGSSDSFLEQLEHFNVVVEKEVAGSGMSGSRHQGFKRGTHEVANGAVLWIEPEKSDFITSSVDAVLKPIQNGEADIVIPKRSALSFSHYPTYQQKTEARGNKLWNQIARGAGILKSDEDLDIFLAQEYLEVKMKLRVYF